MTQLGSTVRIDQPSGDSYMGELVAIAGDRYTLANFAAWYADDEDPYSCAYVDDEVSVSVTPECTVTAFQD